jgi:bacillithiol system protein YtxJ
LALKDRIHFLTSPEQGVAFVKDNPTAAIYKAGTCHKTQEMFQHVQAQLEPREDVALGIIRVVEARPASNRVAEMTGIPHESPQLLLFKEGKAVYDRDNWDITPESIAEALEAHFHRVA